MQKKPLKATLSQNQKYKKALEVGQKIAGVASQVGMPNLKEMFSVLQQLLSYWENNESIVVIPKTGGSSLEHKTTIGGTATQENVRGDSLFDIDAEVKLPNESTIPKDAIQDSESFPSDEVTNGSEVNMPRGATLRVSLTLPEGVNLSSLASTHNPSVVTPQLPDSNSRLKLLWECIKVKLQLKLRGRPKHTSKL